jgi:phenylpyruvate tautomerase PptA (4-oxalocrotonate tautomerase family)
MPIVDVEIVCDAAQGAGAPSATALADALGQVFGSAPGQTWVRLRLLDLLAYAENGVSLAALEAPVFVTVQHAQLPQGAALQAELAAVTQAVAHSLGRAAERVHVQYAPPAAGRQAFGGRLVG